MLMCHCFTINKQTLPTLWYLRYCRLIICFCVINRKTSLAYFFTLILPVWVSPDSTAWSQPWVDLLGTAQGRLGGARPGWPVGVSPGSAGWSQYRLDLLGAASLFLFKMKLYTTAEMMCCFKNMSSFPSLTSKQHVRWSMDNPLVGLDNKEPK